MLVDIETNFGGDREQGRSLLIFAEQGHREMTDELTRYCSRDLEAETWVRYSLVVHVDFW